jgi:predicted nucleotide-binding protein
MRSDLPKYFSAATAAASIGLVSSVMLHFVNSKQSEAFGIIVGIGAVITAALSAYILVRQRAVKKERRVFIIYAKEDLQAAKKIAELLKERGFEPWLDVEQIEAGQIWGNAISDALDESVMAIVLLSKNFPRSTIATRELKQAISKMQSGDRNSSPIIPIKLDEVDIPSDLSHIQYVDLRDENASDFLVKSLKGTMRRIVGTTQASTSGPS